ncbi:MAG: hypothetical protein OXC57_05945 [Rhodobacteraceae bacterium]|nr:hypothetical protein [Paracoccaceae bacterium]
MCDFPPDREEDMPFRRRTGLNCLDRQVDCFVVNLSLQVPLISLLGITVLDCRLAITCNYTIMEYAKLAMCDKNIPVQIHDVDPGILPVRQLMPSRSAPYKTMKELNA